MVVRNCYISSSWVKEWEKAYLKIEEKEDDNQIMNKVKQFHFQFSLTSAQMELMLDGLTSKFGPT